ncbi:hypothetical protein PHLGIDRAFT_436707 [Phlebiopsis gigantea 11061_1 CR5-6]|uniref:Uncharacterized protein n=1 Tax=Phlebiopsis gigantea (strain 11061_1 CR5-6) TaxID=745531 RepID=A0A0C3PV50_PHLG1|nr:hypothetical protein PHLGIDRAFT_436707 [Phlebiopsis gigantea 11061_1 CR5-6]
MCWYWCDKCDDEHMENPREHFRRRHETTTTICFAGDYSRTRINRIDGGLWKCPKCHKTFEGCSRRIQTHASNGVCLVSDRVRRVRRKYIPSNSARQSKAAAPRVRRRRISPSLIVSINDSAELSESDQDAEIVIRTPGVSPTPDDRTVSHPHRAQIELPNNGEDTEEEVNDEEMEDDEAEEDGNLKEEDSEGEESDGEGEATGQAQADQTRPIPPVAGPSHSAQDFTVGVAQRPTPPPLLDLLAKLRRRREVSATTQPSPDRAAVDNLRQQVVFSAADPPSSEDSRHEANSHRSSPRAEDPAAVPEQAGPLAAGPSTRSRPAIPSAQSSAPISHALRTFLDTLRTPLDGLASIFIDNGFDSEASLDILSELPPEGNWENMKQEILAKGRLAGWLTVKHALQQRRASVLGREQHA